MRYGSVCSGIEAATVAWHPLGWSPVFFSEIDPFARTVLKHRYPDVPLHGDFRTIEAGSYGAIDVLVGGTPCQSFSVAGERGGMDDERGVLAFEYLRLAERLRPEWLVWENVPGLLSLNGGRDFGTILGRMAQLGYGFAYRVLDAQFHGVPQRRRRVFVVGHFGDWRRAAAVLFERHSLSGDPPPRRSAGQGIAPTIASRASAGGGLGADFDCDGGLLPAIAPAIPASGRGFRSPGETRGQDPVVAVFGGGAADLGLVPTKWRNEPENGLDTIIAHTLRYEGFDASEDGTGRGTPIIPILKVGGILSFSAKDHGNDVLIDTAPTLRAMAHSKSHVNGGGQVAIAFNARQDPDSAEVTHPLDTDGHSVAVAFAENQRSELREMDVSSALNVRGGKPGEGYPAAVRRLTPRECERLQGFPDDWTLVPYRGKAAKDGPRYKALGNSMAVPVMRWIGQRIARFG